jgi:hypothetical protein
LLTFFGEAKKVSGCRAAPGNASLIEENTASPTTNPKPSNNKKSLLNKQAFSKVHSKQANAYNTSLA